MNRTPTHIRGASNVRARRRGFTLIEVLATLMLMAIAMPAVMHAVTLATRAASFSRRHTEASMLAASKLNDLVWTGQWQNESSGDFGEDWPDYTWTCQTSDWTPTSTNGSNVIPALYQQMQQLDLTVTWGPLDDNTMTLSTLVYPNSPTSSMAVTNAAAAASSASTGTTP